MSGQLASCRGIFPPDHSFMYRQTLETIINNNEGKEEMLNIQHVSRPRTDP